MIVTVYATFADVGEAERIARTVVEARLAACANILAPCQSVYRWQGALEYAQEVPALFKTTAPRAHALVERIAELHSYETPAIVVWPIAETLPVYAGWVEAETG